MNQISEKLNKVIVIFLITFFTLTSLYTTISANQEQADTEKNPEDILATVNDEIITLADFEKYWSMIPENYKVQLKKEDLLEQMITQSLLIQKSDELNLRNDPDISFQIKAAVEQILIQSLLEREIVEKTILTDEDYQKYYDEHKEEYWQEEEVHAFDILVETKEQAEQILQKLTEGQDFTTIAKESSIASTAENGGDLNFVKKGTLTDEIDETLFALEIGEISEIIAVEKGFHIFKVTEKRPSRYLELLEVKEGITNQLLPTRQQEAFDQYLKDIEEQAAIVKNVELINTEEEAVEEQKEENPSEILNNE
ncbi:MAG: peptidyl-prolyl cis-trans isomerase [Candidatus Atribacteria bacterium]|nr:peptidyl-prolyl cis-trans isomerase [Candidatus Atribacteria bacterium]